MKCKWYAEFEGTCTNGECPYRGDTCPTSEYPEVCKYAEEKPKPELNAEELVTALRICAGPECEGCPCRYLSELGISCGIYIKRKSADMLEKLAAERKTHKMQWVRVEDRLPKRDNICMIGASKLNAVSFGVYRAKHWICGIEDQEITCWMELPDLPDLPKEEKQ